MDSCSVSQVLSMSAIFVSVNSKVRYLHWLASMWTVHFHCNCGAAASLQVLVPWPIWTIKIEVALPAVI